MADDRDSQYTPTASILGSDIDAESEDGEGTYKQAIDILASLTSLGISPQLRDQVQGALQQLQQASDNAAQGLAAWPRQPDGSSGGPQKQGRSKGTQGGGNASLAAGSLRAGASGQMVSTKTLETMYQKKIEGLEGKLAMSRSIMRKLYHKNVALEKDIQIMTANRTPITFSSQAPSPAASQELHSPARLLSVGPDREQESFRAPGGEPPTPSRASTGQSPLMVALKERDETIVQLQQALDAARRRSTLLEGQISAMTSNSSHGSSPSAAASAGSKSGARKGERGKVKGGVKETQGLRDIMAQSQLHAQKYKQIREDYNRLLYRRAGSIQTSKAASAVAKSVVDDIQTRLKKEVAEREAEAALYSARLYESEKLVSDWYVEKRMLEDHIQRLREEVSARDRLDQEIESCVAGMFERLRLVEAMNEELKAQLPASDDQLWRMRRGADTQSLMGGGQGEAPTAGSEDGYRQAEKEGSRGPANGGRLAAELPGDYDGESQDGEES